MITYTGLQIPTPILRELLDFLHWRNSELDPSEAAAQAIRAWLDEMRRKVLMAEDQEPDGYLVLRIPGETRPKLAYIVRREQHGTVPRRRSAKAYKPPKSPLAEIPDWVMNNRRKNCKCMGDTMFED